MFLVVGVSSGVRAQENALSLTSAETIPGSSVSILLTAQLGQPIRAFQVGIEFPRRAMALVDVGFEGTELEGRRLDVFKTTVSASGLATLEVSLDERSPFRTDIPAGTVVILARLDFEMKQGLAPGADFPITLGSGLGFPAIEARVFTAAGALPVALGGGTIRIFNENVLRIRNVDSVRPGDVSTLEFIAFNLEPLQGFTISMSFDPERVHFLSATVDDTITEAVGAEFIDPVVDNENGVFILGVLLDVMPPFENQLIPASGLALSVARADFVVLPPDDPAAPVETKITLTLVDGLGKPPKKNIFTIDNQSVSPRTQDGMVVVNPERAFLRGDAAIDGRVDITDAIRVINYAIFQNQMVPCQKAADGNDDGRVDLADVVYILRYLFDRGGVIPPPFPLRGFDPTFDRLTCESDIDDVPPANIPR